MPKRVQCSAASLSWFERCPIVSAGRLVVSDSGSRASKLESSLVVGKGAELQFHALGRGLLRVRGLHRTGNLRRGKSSIIESLVRYAEHSGDQVTSLAMQPALTCQCQ